MSDTRLYRSVHGRVIGGVAGGLADFFGMDPTIVRLIFVLLVIFGGSGVLLYLILWIILPEKNQYTSFYSGAAPPNPAPAGSDTGIGETYEGFEQGRPAQPYYQAADATPEMQQRKKVEGSLIGGVVLIFIGSIFLIERFVPRIDFGDLWPVILIAIGLVLIVGNLPRKGNKDAASGPADEKNENNPQTF
ncbi:MAG TPA: PspC domain-containing protein [Lentimicrobium sp.]|nr:PspC domain-containing protein [Lentimicrobium sp.]